MDNQDSENWLFEVFQTMDQNCDGLLNLNELMKIVKLYNLEIDEKDIDAII